MDGWLRDQADLGPVGEGSGLGRGGFDLDSGIASKNDYTPELVSMAIITSLL